MTHKGRLLAVLEAPSVLKRNIFADTKAEEMLEEPIHMTVKQYSPLEVLRPQNALPQGLTNLLLSAIGADAKQVYILPAFNRRLCYTVL